MHIKKILVGTDYSQQAIEAVGHAVAIAQACDAELRIVHVLPSIPLDPPYPVGTGSLYRNQTREILEQGQKQLAREVGRWSHVDVELSHDLVIDLAAPGILAAAESYGADLIVVGTHGRTGVTRFLLGSVAQKVAQRATCDVLVTRGPIPKSGYREVLVPTDFSQLSRIALARAHELVANEGSIHLLHCWQLPGGTVDYWGPAAANLSEAMQKAAQELAAAMMSPYKEKLATVAFQQKQADARHGIRESLDEERYDLVVMGSHGRTGLSRLLLGSVAQATIRHAPISVYVARQESATETP